MLFSCPLPGSRGRRWAPAAGNRLARGCAGLQHVGVDILATVGRGDTVLIPPDTKHVLVNESEAPLLALALWWGGETHVRTAVS